MAKFPVQNNHAQWENLNEVLRDPNMKSWILMNPTSNGDTWTVCALANAFKKKHGGAITMVLPHSQVALAQMYSADIDRIFPVDRLLLHDLCTRTHHFSTFFIDQPIVAHPHWHGDGRLIELINLFRFPGRGGINVSDWFRFTLHLDWDAPLQAPNIPTEWRDEAESYAKEVGIVPGESVILFPDNNCIQGLPLEFWQPLANLLTAKGLKVFTNMFGNALGARTEIFSGTFPISVPLRLAIPLVELAGRFISCSNGLAHTLVGSKAKTQYCWITIYRESTERDDKTYLDQFTCQSLRYTGLEYGDINEYIVCPEEDMTAVIRAIADNDASEALPKTGYPESFFEKRMRVRNDMI